MRRTALVYVLPAIIIASAWMRLEDPSGGGGDALWIVLLALVPALLPSLGLRLLVTGPVVLFAAWLALDRPLGEGGFFPIAWDRVDTGLAHFYDVRVPFSALEYPEMHGVVLLAIFGFCFALGLAAASRRPLPTVLVLLAGAGWPATLLQSQGVAFGALILVAALWILAGLRVERPTFALAAGVLVVLVAAGASTTAAVARDGVLGWQRWDPYGGPDAPVSVSYVWDANYSGIDFPKQKTTVLRISGTNRSLYWRATTLNRFVEDHWREQLEVRVSELATGELPSDPLLPVTARDEDDLVTHDVEVVGLRDEHLVAASTPVGIDGDSLGLVTKYADGLVGLNRDLERGERYTVSSYAPTPRPVDLAQLEADYPDALDQYLRLERKLLPEFGSPGREAAAAEIFDDDSSHSLSAYQGLSQQAEQNRAGGTHAVRRRGCDRGVAAHDGRLRLRRAAAVLRGRAAARLLRRGEQARLLPAVRRRHGPDAALPRHSGARGSRLRERHVPRRRLDGDRPQRACLGRGLVPGVRLADVRPDPGTRRAGGELQRLLADLQPGRRFTRVHAVHRSRARPGHRARPADPAAGRTRAERAAGERRGGYRRLLAADPRRGRASGRRSGSQSSPGVARATSRAIRGGWRAPRAVSSPTSSSTRV